MIKLIKKKKRKIIQLIRKNLKMELKNKLFDIDIKRGLTCQF